MGIIYRESLEFTDPYCILMFGYLIIKYDVNRLESIQKRFLRFALIVVFLGVIPNSFIVMNMLRHLSICADITKTGGVH